MPKIPSNQDFDEKLKLIHGEKYIRIENRVSNQKNIKCFCNICKNFWFPRIRHLLKGFGCPNCRKTTSEEFDKKCELLFNGKYKRIGNYPENQSKSVQMECQICLTQNIQKVSHVLSGHGCKKCGHEKTIDAQRYTLDEIIKKSIEINGAIYDFSLVDKKLKLNIKTKIPIICKKHGVFYQLIGSHIHNKCGCPKCKESKGEKRIRLFLEQKNIIYEKNKKFDNCKYKRKLPFDFYINKLNLLIEYDGEQHFKKLRFGFGKKMTNESKENYLKTLQLRDKIKDEYCKNNNIRLLRINYKNYENIEKILELALHDFFIPNSDFKC